MADEEAPKKLSPAERQQLKREEKLQDIKEQISAGDLTVRKPTKKELDEWKKRAAEREKNPKPKKRR
ncbi:MAG: hypothetical protein H0V29_05285 [Thermoleophilaceae bacterium]|nr:hypothetical protein [Thermoleophilaceae bacterium]